MPYEQRLTGMVFFSLENNSFRRDLVPAFEYIIKKMEPWIKP